MTTNHGKIHESEITPLAQERMRRGMSVKQLSKETGIPVQTLYTWEQGNKPRAQAAAILAAYFNKDIQELFPSLGGRFLPDPQTVKTAVHLNDGVPLRGYVEAGVWRHAAIGKETENPLLPLPRIPGTWGLEKQFAYEVTAQHKILGESFKNNFIICVPYFHARDKITNHDVCIIERTRNNLVETSPRIIDIKDPAKLVLRTIGTAEIDHKLCPTLYFDIDPPYIEPDGTTVEIIALMLGRWIPINV
jgi:transcriptional regulator with XRE-family HTH domain